MEPLRYGHLSMLLHPSGVGVFDAFLRARRLRRRRGLVPRMPSGMTAGVEGGKRVPEAVRAYRILTSERGGGTRRRTRPAGPVLILFILGGLRPGKGLGD